jgi:hypothetical protein
MEAKKWIGGIVTALLITVIGYAIINYPYPGNPFLKPDVRVDYFDMSSPEGPGILFNQNDWVKATITVANKGRAYAEDCRVHWKSDGLGDGDDKVSHPFSLGPNDKNTVTLESVVTNKYGSPPTNLTARTWVSCANCASEEKTENITVGYLTILAKQLGAPVIPPLSSVK